MNNSPSRFASCCGSTLVVVIMFSGVMALLGASLLMWSSTEQRLNYRTALRLESRNAAEALAEYGFSQIRQKFETRSTFSLNPTGSDALRLPPSSFWAGSNIPGGSVELIGGTIQNVITGGSALYYVDPADPNNEFDPLKGKWIFRRDVAVIAKATINPLAGFGTPVVSYVMEKISVRGAPLFAHAIFFNMDMEIFPGPAMSIYGPVHVNGNIYCSSQGNQLNFRGPVTCTKDIFHSWKNNAAGMRGSGTETLGTSPVRFLNRSGTLVDIKDAGGVWKDSTMGGSTSGNMTTSTAFRAYASQTWNGNLQTGMHGIQDYKPVAVGAYKEQTPGTTDANDDSNNSGRVIIEPPSWPVTGDADYDKKLEVEKQKFSNNAGIYIKIDPVAKQIVSIESRKKGGIGTASSVKTLSDVATTNYKGIFNYVPYATAPTAGTKTTTNPPTPTGGSNGDTKTTTGSEVTPETVTVTGGLYDRRRAKGIDLVEIDMGRLKTAVAEMQKTAGTRVVADAIGDTPNDAAGDKALVPDDWTGIVYVEIQGAPTTNIVASGTLAEGSTNAAATTAATTTAIRVINAAIQVPSFAGTNSSEGLTIATNGPLYTKGHFNADGTTSTGGTDPSQSSANKPETGEVPAALVADAITLLSSGFNESTTYKETYTSTAPTSQLWTKSGGVWTKTGAKTTGTAVDSTHTVVSVGTPSAGADIEVSAALLMGVTPTGKNGVAASSGGVHNFPRFLENWNPSPQRAVWIRGSLVGLFESRVASEKWAISYYGAPARNWGFNDLFRQGRYPPGTPRVLSYRRVDFTDLNATQYGQVKTSFNWGP